jgi:hypothetical protein
MVTGMRPWTTGVVPAGGLAVGVAADEAVDFS